MPIVKVYNEAPELELPKYETSGAAGMDIYCTTDTEIPASSTKLVPTGLYVEIPEGFEIQVRPRSGLSYKTPLRVANAPGTIDHDYRGQINVIVWNTGMVPFTVKKGERIAQIVLQEVPKIEWQQVSTKEELTDTSRGAGGFGSTGN